MNIRVKYLQNTESISGNLNKLLSGYPGAGTAISFDNLQVMASILEGLRKTIASSDARIQTTLTAWLALVFPGTPAVNFPLFERFPTSLNVESVMPEHQILLSKMLAHLRFISSTQGGNLIAEQTVEYVRQLWHSVLTALGEKLAVPSATNGPDEDMLLRWTYKHLEMEVLLTVA